ncbi:hypothetical protein Ddc_24811 [Ditylenchus destructor]|nr:hypothetical protein Ddc_24811 [Ditylenchus destructor]
MGRGCTGIWGLGASRPITGADDGHAPEHHARMNGRPVCAWKPAQLSAAASLRFHADNDLSQCDRRRGGMARRESAGALRRVGAGPAGLRHRGCHRRGWHDRQGSAVDRPGEGLAHDPADRGCEQHRPFAGRLRPCREDPARAVGIRHAALYLGKLTARSGVRAFVEAVGLGAIAALASRSGDHLDRQKKRETGRSHVIASLSEALPMRSTIKLDGARLEGPILAFEAMNIALIGPNLPLVLRAERSPDEIIAAWLPPDRCDAMLAWLEDPHPGRCPMQTAAVRRIEVDPATTRCASTTSSWSHWSLFGFGCGSSRSPSIFRRRCLRRFGRAARGIAQWRQSSAPAERSAEFPGQARGAAGSPARAANPDRPPDLAVTPAAPRVVAPAAGRRDQRAAAFQASAAAPPAPDRVSARRSWLSGRS